MKITNKTQTEQDVETLEIRIAKTLSSLKYTASQLNAAYDSVWKLSDDRLQSLLQALVDVGKFEEIFGLHAHSAAGINALLVAAGENATAKEGAGREYTITDGIVSLKPIVYPDVVVPDIE